MSHEMQLREGECRVFVDYQIPHDKEALEVEFSKDCVSELFYGNYEWLFHPSCVGIDRTQGERIMRACRFWRSNSHEDSINEMKEEGYRPAIHLEAYAFGSYVMRGIERQIALLDSYCVDDRRIVTERKRVFFHGCFDSGRSSYDMFLFVREDLPKAA
jgi:hypothetical protein